VKLFVDAAYDKPDHASIWLEWSSSVREEVWPRYTRLLDKALERIAPTCNGPSTTARSERAVGAGSGPLLTGFGYVMMQMINQPQRPSREEVTDFLFKYVTAHPGQLTRADVDNAAPGFTAGAALSAPAVVVCITPATGQLMLDTRWSRMRATKSTRSSMLLGSW
jgi:hypothetical protein